MNTNEIENGWSRREFLTRATGTVAGAAALTALNPKLGLSQTNQPAAVTGALKRRIKIGLVGCGGRGSWIAGLFQKHGGYDVQAVADYFQTAADTCGDELGVNKARRFSTLSGYKRVMESGVEAVVLEVPPYFLPEQAQAAVDAGLHVYMAKPIAADVPGCLAIREAARNETIKKRVFLVDYQMPADPSNREVRKRILADGFGKISHVSTVGVCGSLPDPAFGPTIEERLRGLVWVNDIALGCDYIGNYDIHAIDAALWVLGRSPVAAVGGSSICRPDPHGDSRDVCSLVYEYSDGLVHNHFGQALANQNKNTLSCTIHGQKGYGILRYLDKAEFRCFDDAWRGDVINLYEDGAMRNIDAFYRNVTEGRLENETVPRAVDSALVCILGREAAARKVRLTMGELLKENKKLEVDLKGLQT